jgi:hypothetical protein
MIGTDNRDGTITGKTYLCVLDKDESIIAGTFTVQVLSYSTLSIAHQNALYLIAFCS